MSTTSSKQILSPRRRYHRAAYEFVDAALRYTQRKMGRITEPHQGGREEDAHITGQELLEGIRELAVEQFGLMALTVFRHWGVCCTDDFGRIVFDFIEQGLMRKTERDQLSDFFGVYDFQEVFDRRYQINTREAFKFSR